jgi:UDP-N-acetyl-D-glucosamine/UDP-N-acetyl-D-galactosamine dehydrogenase
LLKNGGIYIPWIDAKEAHHEYELGCRSALPAAGQYDAIIVAVGHKQCTQMSVERMRQLGSDNALIYDVKSAFPREVTDGRL